MKQREHAVPEWRMYVASMPVRALHIKTVQKQADGNSAGMAARTRLGYAMIDVDLVI